MIRTDDIDSFFESHEEAPMEQVVIEATSEQWGDAINALTAISALVGNKYITVLESTKKVEVPKYERDWEWMNRDDGSNIIRKRKNKQDHNREG